MKKTQLLLLSLLLALPINAWAEQPLRGDVDLDGGLSIGDVTALMDYLLKGSWADDPVTPPTEDDWVDLGLPSGTMWATRNIGASAPEDYGDYFAWGETTPKDYYDWSTYKWCKGNYYTLTKYCTKSSYGYDGFVDNKTELDPEDDAATANWGSVARMPSQEQIKELCDNCTWQLTQRNGVNGQLVTGPNGNTIFLPMAGIRWIELNTRVGRYGDYWSRTIDPDYFTNYACELQVSITENRGFLTDNYRFYGFTVRAVRVSQDAEQPLRGDVDFDGTVSVSDVLLIIDYLLKGSWADDPTPPTEDDWVDLGLPSGTIWATRNIGATCPEDYGDYFAWGETEPKDYYDWNISYKWCKGNDITLTKYCTMSDFGYNGFVDNKTELDPEDDAATANWGSVARMPLPEQYEELCNYCTWQWTQRNGVNGQLVTGPNGNTIFLPAAGYRWYESLYVVGSSGGYWSRAIHSDYPNNAFLLYFTTSYLDSGYSSFRNYGYTVRAVRVS